MLVMLAAIPMSVSAEDFKGKDGWKVSFDGDKMDSTFKVLILMRRYINYSQAIP